MEEHFVIINWGDGTTTTLFLPPEANQPGGSGTFSFFPIQTHKRKRSRQQVTVSVLDQQVQLYGGGFTPSFVLKV